MYIFERLISSDSIPLCAVFLFADRGFTLNPIAPHIRRP